MTKRKLFIIISSVILLSLIGITVLLIVFDSSPIIKNTITIEDRISVVDETNATYITMSDENNNVSLTTGGTYVLSGSCDDGIIYIKGDKQIFNIVFDSLSLKSSSSCLVIDDAKKVYLNIKKDTCNSLESLGTYTFTNSNKVEETTTGCIYSKDDITINGEGELVINSFDDGIVCHDTLIIVDSNLSITSNRGLDANDSIQIENANIVIDSKCDGIHCDSTNKSFITIVSGIININSNYDGIRSSGLIGILDGTVDITSGKGLSTLLISRCGIKSDTYVCIKCGSITIDSSDKSIKANELYLDGGSITTLSTGIKGDSKVKVNGSTLNIKSNADGINTDGKFILENGNVKIYAKDDGVHAVKKIDISGGYLDITYSYEGLETIYYLQSGGEVHVYATDDGININCEPNENMGGGMNSKKTYASSSGVLKVTGGFIYVNAKGDGLDSNDEIYISGGTVIVDGPSDNGNGALDYDTKCKVTGGTLLAVGSSGMAQNVSSGQTSFLVNVSASANKVVLITDSNNNFICAYKCKKQIQTVVFSSNKLKVNNTYNIYVGATIDGEDSCGYYSSGTITSFGTKSTSFKLSSKIYGSSGGMGGGGGMRR